MQYHKDPQQQEDVAKDPHQLDAWVEGIELQQQEHNIGVRTVESGVE